MTSIEWKKRERTWLIEDIEFQINLIEKLKPHIKLKEWKEREEKLLKEKRSLLKLLREDGLKYEQQSREKLSRIPVGAEIFRRA